MLAITLREADSAAVRFVPCPGKATVTLTLAHAVCHVRGQLL